MRPAAARKAPGLLALVAIQAGRFGRPSGEVLTDVSSEAAVRMQRPPHGLGESARQNCASQRFVTCVALPTNVCAELRGSSTARATTAQRHRAIAAIYDCCELHA